METLVAGSQGSHSSAPERDPKVTPLSCPPHVPGCGEFALSLPKLCLPHSSDWF